MVRNKPASSGRSTRDHLQVMREGFDPQFYFDRYLKNDAHARTQDPFEHYLGNVKDWQLDPSPAFSESLYLSQNPDVARAVDRGAYLCGFHHFIAAGMDEGAGTADAGTGPEITDPIREQTGIIESSGLFDADWYFQTCPDLADSGLTPLEHFCNYGWEKGYRPNPFFDPLWYLEQNPDALEQHGNPLIHFIAVGDAENRAPAPYFDSVWYKSKFVPEDYPRTSLAHFLENRRSGTVTPTPLFDVRYYLTTYSDVAQAKVDPFEHYLFYGFLESRDPSADFDTKYYLTRHLGGDTRVNPLVHYITEGRAAGLLTAQSDEDVSMASEVERFSRPGAYFEEANSAPRAGQPDVKLIAYYLPQFHSFPENDTWWGKGFTEWTNIARGLPRFPGHYQPRVPRDLGFYDLTNPEVMKRQVALARAAGLYGFCFYYYWFNGRRLMERPVEAFLADPKVDFPFCLMWANENWTRRWDGEENEILIAQDYETGDDTALIADFARHMKDSRYIRIGGRPLLMVYRPGLIPNVIAAVERWRKLFKELANEDPILVMAQTFGDTDPARCGFDGAIEFPPHKLTGGDEAQNQNAQVVNQKLTYFDHGFKAQVFEYDGVIASSLDRAAPSFPLIKTAVPSWDNDARRQGKGLVITGSTPAKYESWLRQLAEYARRHKFFGESFVCINAWNEWCEGAYLEPDLHFGSAYLNATYRALHSSKPVGRRKILLVGHDAFPSGSQHLLLNLAILFSSRFGIEVAFVLLGDGKMLERYRAVARVDVARSPQELRAMIAARRADGYADAVVNTTASARAVPILDGAGFQSVMLVHELPRIMKEKNLIEGARIAASIAKALVFPSQFVADRFAETIEDEIVSEIVIQPQGSYHSVEPSADARVRIRKGLGIGTDDRVLLNLGYADLRKGFDLFLQLWRQSQAGQGRTHFIWCGDIDPGLESWLGDEIRAAAASGTFHHLAFTQNVDDYYAAADVLVLTSREDPFPTVVLEAIGTGMPVVVFDGAGGIPEIVAPEIGRIVPYGDVAAMLAAAIDVTRRPPSRDETAARRQLIAQNFNFPDYGWALLEKLGVAKPRISVIVPNYNYARYLRERLRSIFEQSAPIFEVIVLDDASTDDSLAELQTLGSEFGREFALIGNKKNSGSAFEQWRRGIEAARGELVWIAEADDISDPAFLETLVRAFEDPEVIFAFSDSRAIDPDGKVIWPSYKEYYATVGPGLLTRDATMPAQEFLAEHLSVKNLIMNVSAVVWRRSALVAAMAKTKKELADLRVAGDWRLYAEACLATDGGRVCYVAEPLNSHRRHADSVTHALDSERHLAEIKLVQGVIDERLPSDGTRQTMQRRYIKELAAQFGVPADVAADLSANPSPAVPQKEPRGSSGSKRPKK